MSQQVTGLIHWQAVKLAMKRVPFHHKPRFAPGEGSRPAPEPGRGAGPARAASAAGPPAAPARSPRSPGAPRLWALRHPERGRVSVRLPDGTVRRGGDPATGPDVG